MQFLKLWSYYRLYWASCIVLPFTPAVRLQATGSCALALFLSGECSGSRRCISDIFLASVKATRLINCSLYIHKLGLCWK
ncbi:hypothetical protein BD414DRAFT_481511 [Trametes punicea]|nr:hypothetical protein BD414DRAFT_481511 [Trametes punicea]